MRKKKRWALIMAIVMLVLSVPNSMIQAQEIQSTQEFAIECAVESESNPLYGFNSETSTAVTFESAQQTSAPGSIIFCQSCVVPVQTSSAPIIPSFAMLNQTCVIAVPTAALYMIPCSIVQN